MPPKRNVESKEKKTAAKGIKTDLGWRAASPMAKDSNVEKTLKDTLILPLAQATYTFTLEGGDRRVVSLRSLSGKELTIMDLILADMKKEGVVDSGGDGEPALPVRQLEAGGHVQGAQCRRRAGAVSAREGGASRGREGAGGVV